ncbi:RHS repeat-associated core domain-containing protein [Geothrix sp. PMB-07]|uniref:RHS repeat-associated core domain-containing protein n=1 Tax=Geothrix sp. PMB-07 TaxID=3068640 RepID=UPI002741C833|nr:RHS repeat-associated core domain-containing protein [Geothrix sp. PMB-07]WLT30663.1 RHS repeat-associated core domain-containing protein [Geothrix sp. PMB-07]
MSIGRILRFALGAILAVCSLRAQITANARMPPVVDMTRNGWDVSLQNGNLTFAIPLTVVPGEVPVPVAFGMNGTFLSQVVAGPWRYIYRPDGTIVRRISTSDELLRPVVGAIHFGYISSPTTVGATAGNEEDGPFLGHEIEGITVLEDGSQIPDRDWTPFSTHSELGTTLNLPQAYGFRAVSTSTALVDPTARYLSYSTTVDGLGATYQSIVQGLSISGFGDPNPAYKVVMDKNRARVYAFATALATWVPVLWADRFGHYVTFSWGRTTSGFPAGSPSTLTAISSVTATNQRSKGVVLRWAEHSSTTSVVDILRLDYLGLDAPSLLVRGYPGPSSASPANALSQIASRRFLLVPSLVGAFCRPTSIQVGPTAVVPQPIWTSPSGPGKQVPPNSPQADIQAPTQSWTFSYDSASAELASCTDPMSVTTQFTYANYAPSTRGVTQVDSVDGNQIARSMRWTRTFGNPSTVKLEGWWDPSQMTNPDRYHLYTFPTNSLNNGNGVYQTDALMDTTGKTWSTTTYSYSAQGAGLNAGLSGVESIAISRNGAPTLTTTLGYANNSSKLQITSQAVTATDVSGKAYKVSETVNTYGTRWDMLEGRQLTQSVTGRYKPDGVTALPTVTQKQVWDTPTSGPALLQLQKSYLDAGATGRHGSTYAYDTQGRPSSVDVYHLEGTTEVVSPNTQTMAYDAVSGAQASVTTTDNTVSPGTSISQSMGGFDSWGRATTQTDAAGVTTTFAFDDRGRVTSKARPGSPTISYAYPDELTTTVTVNGLETKYVYDGFHRLQKLTKPNGSGRSIVQTSTYDVYGRLVSLRETTSAGTTRNESWAYDALDRPTSHTPVAGTAIATSYDVSGINSQVTTTLSNGSATTVLTDPFGQTVKVTSPDGTQTTSTYDQFGNRTNLSVVPTTGGSQVRSWAFDALGRLTSKIEPETNTQLYQNFNALNQPTSITEAYGTSDARSRILSFDGFGRVLTMGNLETSLSNTYIGVNLTSSSRGMRGGATVQQIFTYGGVGGRLSSESTIQPGLTTTIGYDYDASTGSLTALTYPSGRVVGYGYDGLGRVISISNNGTPLVNNINFDEWGNRYQTQFASGAQDQWDADLTGARLKSWNIGYVGGGPDGRSYAYDDATNILKTAGEWSLTHDNAGRVTEADGFGIKTAHTYDGYGNATSHLATSNGAPVPPTFNNFNFNPLANNQIPGMESNGALTGWNTNLRGEATQVGTATSSGTALGLGWDGLGSLSSVVWGGGNQSYLYAPSGMRVSLADSLNNGDNRKYAYTQTGLLVGELKPGNGLGGGGTSVQADGGIAGPTATAHSGKKAVRVWHKTGTLSAIARSVGSFDAGDTVSATVWFNARPGVSGVMFLGNTGGTNAYDNYVQQAVVGNGNWQSITLTHTLTRAMTASDGMALFIYGDNFSSTTGEVTNADSVIYDDVMVVSTQRGVILQEGFENGLANWSTSGQPNDVLNAYTSAGAWREAIYLGSQAIAEIDATGVHELHSDHLGSPRLITRGNGTWDAGLIGTVEATQAYGPYGELLSRTGSYVPLTGYTGHIQTDASGLIYMRGRYYSPAWHAFVNSDQGVDPSTWNQRAYLGGSPFMGTDPSGDSGFFLRIWNQLFGRSGGDDMPGTIVEVIDKMPGDTPTVNIPPAGWYPDPGASNPSRGGGQGGQQQSSKPNDCQPSGTTDNSLITGSGFFYGGAAELSIVAPIGAGSFSNGIGAVSGERLTFSSSGSTTAVDAQSRGDWGWGANAGVGGGLWFTNAKGANPLNGPSRTTDVAIGPLGFSFSRNTDGSWVFQYGMANRGVGFGVHHYTTTTSVTRRCK